MSTFHIRDKITKKYYSEFNINYNYFNNRPVNSTMEFAVKGYGKAFKDLGKLKSHLLFIVGITMAPKEILEKESSLHKVASNSIRYKTIRNELDTWHALHPGYSNLPDWLHNSSPIESISDTLEIVEVVDKKTKLIIVVDLDPFVYTEHAKRLRLITDTYGAAVKDVYKKLEKANKLNILKYVAAISVSLDAVDLSASWNGDIKISPDIVNATLKQMEIKRTDMVKSTKDFSMAVAFKDHETAVWFSLTYTGPDSITLLDIEKLEEIVQEKQIP